MVLYLLMRVLPQKKDASRKRKVIKFLLLLFKFNLYWPDDKYSLLASKLNKKKIRGT
jgi:hypothetical protein